MRLRRAARGKVFGFRRRQSRRLAIAKSSRFDCQILPDAAARMMAKFARGCLGGVQMWGFTSFYGCARAGGLAPRPALCRWLAAASAAVVLVPATTAAQQNSDATAAPGTVRLPEVRVIATTPVAPPAARPAAAPAAAAATTPPAAEPGAVDRDKIPSNVQVLTTSDFDHATAPDLLQAIVRGLPGVALSDQTGNQFQLDINYRGFVASPVIGTPQGLAVYQNGVSINEVFGDIINWDFLPENAINRMTLVPSNPIYGLNAIGGALSLEMKNGFTYHGVQIEVSGGSFGRTTTSVQAGGQTGNLSGYVTADAIDDAGWREDSPSRLRRMYTDFGARGDNNTEFHLAFTGADNHFGALAATPVEMLAQNWSSVFTTPQTTDNQLAFFTGSASWKPTDTLTYQAVAYYRHFQQAHVDGNGTNAQNAGCPDPTVLCLPNLDGTVSNLTTTTGRTVPATGPLASAVLGEIDRTWTTTNSFGGSAQAASSATVFGHSNNGVIGASVDRGLVQFVTTSELGTISGIPPTVQGTGLFIDQPSGDVAPVGLGAQTLYTGLYATDTPRRHLAPFRHRRRPVQLRPDQLAGRIGQRSLAHRQPQLQPLQPVDRRDLQDKSQRYPVWRLCGRQPGADAARARMLRSDAAVPARQLAGRGSQSQAGRVAHRGSRPARQCRDWQGPAQLERRRVLRAQYRRHHQRREPDHRP
jgi:TonB-dependent Receptor Plug Domain